MSVHILCNFSANRGIRFRTIGSRSFSFRLHSASSARVRDQVCSGNRTGRPVWREPRCGCSESSHVAARWPRKEEVRPLTVKESMQGESKSMNGVSLLAKRDGAFLRTAERAPSQRVHRHANASRLATSRSTSSGRKPRPEGEAGS